MLYQTFKMYTVNNLVVINIISNPCPKQGTGRYFLADLLGLLFCRNKIHHSGPWRRRTLKVKYLGEFIPTFETAVDHESGDQLSTFSKFTLDKKSHTTVSLKGQCHEIFHLGFFFMKQLHQGP